MHCGQIKSEHAAVRVIRWCSGPLAMACAINLVQAQFHEESFLVLQAQSHQANGSYLVRFQR